MVGQHNRPVAAAEAGAEGGLAPALAQAHAPQLCKLRWEPHRDLQAMQPMLSATPTRLKLSSVLLQYLSPASG